MPSNSGDHSKPWFTNEPVGKHTLATMVKEVCMEAGILKKTSLWATVATAMFTAGVSVKVIQENLLWEYPHVMCICGSELSCTLLNPHPYVD